MLFRSDVPLERHAFTFCRELPRHPETVARFASNNPWLERRTLQAVRVPATFQLPIGEGTAAARSCASEPSDDGPALLATGSASTYE